MKNIVSILFIFSACIIYTTCASVNTQGVTYFVNKSETDLIKQFGYNGVEISNSNTEYDKVMFFTNKVLKYQMSKTNYVDYKTSKSQLVMSLCYNQFSDGCVTYNDAKYYGMHIGIEGVSPKAYTVHRNDNATLVPQINQFNNLINRYKSYPDSQKNAAFDGSNIGDSYYLYVKENKNYYSPGVTGLTRSESYTNYICDLYLVNIVSETRSNTESYIVGQYTERQNNYYTGNGNSVTTFDRVNSIINEYRNSGFTLKTVTEGNSIYAYIKKGQIIKVEEKTSER